MRKIRVSLLFTEGKDKKIVEKKTNRHVSQNKIAIYLLGLKSKNVNYQKIENTSFFYLQIFRIHHPTRPFTVLMINKSDISSMSEHIKP